MSRTIVITTGSRLHFGLLAHSPGEGRQFGGAGMMIDRPGFVVSASIAERDEVCGSPGWRERAAGFRDAWRANAAGLHSDQRWRLQVETSVPPHAGFGSGTQLGMAVAQALALAGGEMRLTPPDLAARIGRGRRSALGIHGFEQGGFLVEAGKRRSDAVSPLAARVAVPPGWRVLLARPEQCEGLSGADEVNAFAELPSMPAATTGRLCQLVLMELLPAFLEADFAAAAEALYQFGRVVGEYFAPVQGGVYANPAMARLVEHLRRTGVQGVGQTSWGPALFILCPDARQAEQLQAELQRSDWGDCAFTVAAPLNTGAAVEFREEPANP